MENAIYRILYRRCYCDQRGERERRQRPGPTARAALLQAKEKKEEGEPLFQ